MIKCAVPKVVDSSCKSSRPLQSVFIDLAGPHPMSTGGSKYLVQFSDDSTKFGWVVFLADGIDPAVVRTFRMWSTFIKPEMGVHNELGCALTDNGTEWVNGAFWGVLVGFEH